MYTNLKRGFCLIVLIHALTLNLTYGQFENVDCLYIPGESNPDDISCSIICGEDPAAVLLTPTEVEALLDDSRNFTIGSRRDTIGDICVRGGAMHVTTWFQIFEDQTTVALFAQAYLELPVSLIQVQIASAEVAELPFVAQYVANVNNNRLKADLQNWIETEGEVRMPCDASGISPDHIREYYDDPATNVNEGDLFAQPFIWLDQNRNQEIDGWNELSETSINDLVCNFSVRYQDTSFPLCGKEAKVLRQWTILDWCSGDIRTFEQLIRIDDQEPPLFHPNEPSTLADVRISSVECEAEYIVPDLIFPPSDACSDTLDVSIRVGGITFNIGDLVQLHEGRHNLEYIVSDPCGNSSSLTKSILINNGTPPVVICDMRAVVTLTSNGEAHVPAFVFDDGSFNIACDSVWFKAIRIDDLVGTEHGYWNGNAGSNDYNTPPSTHPSVSCARADQDDLKPSDYTCFEENGTQIFFDDTVVFCNEDVGRSIIVIFRAFDLNPGPGAILPMRMDMLGGDGSCDMITNDLYTHHNSCAIEVEIRASEGECGPACDDQEPPVFNPNESATANSASIMPWSCEARYEIPRLDFQPTDNCSSQFEYVVIVNGQRYTIGDTAVLAEGEYTLEYICTDECGNASSFTKTLSVEDNVPPVPLCVDNMVVTLTSDLATIFADVFDVGSHDSNCGDVWFKAIRIDELNGSRHGYWNGNDNMPDYTLPPTNNPTAQCPGNDTDDYDFCHTNSGTQIFYDDRIQFCTADIDEPVNVILRVFDVNPQSGPVLPFRMDQIDMDFACGDTILTNDLAGHFNDCIVEVVVQSSVSACTLACNDRVNISLNAAGEVLIKPEFLLENNQCEDLDLKLEILNLERTQVEVSAVGEVLFDQVGEFSYRVTHVPSGNSCWGVLTTIASDQNSNIQCPGNVSIDCIDVIDPYISDVLGVATTPDGFSACVSYNDERTQNNPSCGNGELFRTWYLDFDCNSMPNGIDTLNTCVQLIEITDRFSFAPGSIKWPPHYTGAMENGVLIAICDGSSDAGVINLPGPIQNATVETCSPEWDDPGCGLVGVSLSVDTIYNSDRQIEEIRKNWVVIDWCTWESNTGLDDRDTDDAVTMYGEFDMLDYGPFGHDAFELVLNEVVAECSPMSCYVSNGVYYRYLQMEVDTNDDRALDAVVSVNDQDGYYNFTQVVRFVNATADIDGDGYTADVDCDDTNSNINPGATEIENSGFDENCDGISVIIDEDGDGWNSSIDCDDTNAEINGNAEEIPDNGVDEDCDGEDGMRTSTLELDGVSFSLFPNPAINEVIVEVPREHTIDTEIYNIQGILVARNRRHNSIIDVSELKAGVYVAKLINEKTGSFTTAKLIIHK